MIVVTVGTHEQPFDRLVRAAAALELDDMLVQYGTSTLPHGRGEWVDFVSFDELEERARGARAFVCHAGVGSIVLARRCGHRPIVMARRPELGEHVDEHQLSLTRRLGEAGLVTVVDDEASLAAAILDPVATDPFAMAGAMPGKDALTSEVRSFLSSLGTATLSGRAA